ncbi:MAG TPA: hypothetical protein VE825_14910 [Terriglobales bacterium]|jgi:hypothetical protein|nr:hypothetical protein [Terriglobales bacterium]
MAGKIRKPKTTGLAERIRRVTQDLQALEEEMGWALIEDESRAEQHRLVEELLSFNLVNQFKSSVDHMRHFLWCYIESTMGPRQASVDYLLQSQRLKQVTEMLRVLREQGSAEVGSLPEAATFLEQVTAVVEGYYAAKGETPEEPAPPAGSA